MFMKYRNLQLVSELLCSDARLVYMCLLKFIFVFWEITSISVEFYNLKLNIHVMSLIENYSFLVYVYL